MMSQVNFHKPCVEHEIQELIYLNPLQLIPSLEIYVTEQYNTPTTTPDYYSQKILLNLYQCYPDFVNVEIIHQILLLSLMNISTSNNFLAFSLLIPSKVIATNPKLKNITTLANLLESGKFLEFWTEYRNHEGDFTQLFEKSIRKYILDTITLVFHDLELNTFASYLGFKNESELKSYLSASPDLFEITDSHVTLLNASSSSKVNISEGSVRMDEMFRLLDTLRATSN